MVITPQADGKQLTRERSPSTMPFQQFSANSPHSRMITLSEPEPKHLTQLKGHLSQDTCSLKKSLAKVQNRFFTLEENFKKWDFVQFHIRIITNL